MKVEAKDTGENPHIADLVRHMGQHVQQFSLEFEFHESSESPPALLIDYPLRHLLSGLKKFAASLETLAEKLEYIPLYEEYEQMLIDKTAQCEQQQQEIQELREQLALAYALLEDSTSPTNLHQHGNTTHA